MWTAEKLKSWLKKITSPTVENEHSQISNNLKLLCVLNLRMLTFVQLEK